MHVIHKSHSMLYSISFILVNLNHYGQYLFFAGNTENTREKQSLREVTKCRYKYFGMFFVCF